MKNKYDKIADIFANSAIAIIAIFVILSTLSYSGEMRTPQKVEDNEITINLEVFEEPTPKQEPIKEEIIPEPPKEIIKEEPNKEPEPIPEPSKEIIKEPVPEPIIKEPKKIIEKPKPIIKKVIKKTEKKIEPKPIKKIIQKKKTVKKIESVPIKKKSFSVADKNLLISRLIKLINKNKSYPRLAKKRNITGVVLVKIIISNSKIQSYKILKSRHKLLSRGVNITMKKILNQQLLDKKTPQNLSLSLPIKYELN